MPNASVLNSVFEQFQKFHETLLTEKLDNFKSQKGELEELKEKIMKLEQRNFELEKKLSSNVNPNTSSKENSFNESFSINQDDSTTSFINQKNDSTKLNNNFIYNSTNNSNMVNVDLANNSNNIFHASTPNSSSNNILFQNKLNLVTQSTTLNQQQSSLCTLPIAPQATGTSSNIQNSLNNIPNINQGGFIITSNGIAYVPPMPLQSSIVSRPSSSSNPSSSSGATASISNESALSPFNNNASSTIASNNGLFEEGLKLDFDSLTSNNTTTTATNNNLNNKNSANIDLNSLLSKNIFNSFNTNTNSNQTSPNNSNNIIMSNTFKTNNSSPNSKASNANTAAATTTNQTAFILSNGQLLPVITTNPASTLVTSSSLSPLSHSNHQQLILPASNLVAIHPKPQNTTTVSTTKKVKQVKPKATTTKSKQNKTQSNNQNESSVQVEVSANKLQASTSTSSNLASPMPLAIAQAPAPSINTSPPSLNGQSMLAINNATSSSQNSLKHRAIRPKPSSSSSSTGLISLATFNQNINNNNNANKSQLIVLPAPASAAVNTAAPKLNYGIIKINTIGGANHSQQLVSPKTVNMNNFDLNSLNNNNSSTLANTMMETNDILSKAASMIFSPSEFTLNNLSPHNTPTTTTANSTTTTNSMPVSSFSPNSALNSAIVNFQGNDSSFLLSTVQTPTISSVAPLTSNNNNTQPNKPNKVPIQRNHSQNNMQSRKLANIQPIMPKPESSSCLTSTTKPSITKPSKAKSSESSVNSKASSNKNRKLPASTTTNNNNSETTTNNSKQNKIAIAPLSKIKTSNNKTSTITEANAVNSKVNSMESLEQSSLNINSSNISLINGSILNLKNIFTSCDSNKQQLFIGDNNANDINKLNEQILTFNDLEAFSKMPIVSNNTINSINNSSNNIDLVLKQQEQFDIQIQLQLQSIFSGNSLVFNPIESITKPDAEKEQPHELAKKEESSLKPENIQQKNDDTTDNKKERPKSPDLLMSMPSLEQFFEIDSNDLTHNPSTSSSVIIKHSSKTTTNNKVIKPKQTETKTSESKLADKKQSNQNVDNKKIAKKSNETNKTSADKCDLAIKSNKIQTKTKKKEDSPPKSKSIQIRPKDLKSKADTSPNANEKKDIPDKIKFEFGDLEKVLEQVESIASAVVESSESNLNKQTEKQNNNKNDFLFDLLNDSSNGNGSSSVTDSFKLNTFTINTNCEQNGKDLIKKQLKLDNDKSVLSTPPSLLNNNSNKSTIKKKLKTVQQEQKNASTPVKITSTLDDDDLFSFLNNTDENQQRAPLKPDNHQIGAVKKRGRPPKTGLTNDVKSVKITSKNCRINFDLNSNENSEHEDLDAEQKLNRSSDSTATSRSKKKTSSNIHSKKPELTKTKFDSENDEDNSNILDAAVANTFQELVDKNNLDAITANNPSFNNKENPSSVQSNSNSSIINRISDEQNFQNDEDFNSFVYDIAIDTENNNPDEMDTQTNFNPNQNPESDNQGSSNLQEITIASLAMPKRKRGKLNTSGECLNSNKKTYSSKTTSNKQEVKNDKAKNKKKRRRSASLCDDDDESNEETEENDQDFSDQEKLDESEDNIEKNLDSSKIKISIASIIDFQKHEETIATIAGLTGNSNEKRKRGRPSKQTQAATNSETKANEESNEIGEFFTSTNKVNKPNYKKINNPGGTTSLLALNQCNNNIEYAGLTRFEIPFELSNEEPNTTLTENNNNNNKDNNNCYLEGSCSKSKIQKVDESFNNKTNSILDDQNEFDDKSRTFTCNKQKENLNLNQVKINLEQTRSVKEDTSKFCDKEKNKRLEDKLEETMEHEKLNSSFKQDAEICKQPVEPTNENLLLNNLNDHCKTTVAHSMSPSIIEKNDVDADLFSSNSESTVENDKMNDTTSLKSLNPQNEKLDYDQMNYGSTNVSSTKSDLSYWNGNYQQNTNQSTANVNNTNSHVSHFDLENDPILNNDLQQLHNEQQNQKNNLMNNMNSNHNLIITPPSTVSSVCSSSSNSSTSSNLNSNIYANNHLSNANNLSINPSSTSSNSSTQMISPVGSINSMSDSLSNNQNVILRSSSVEPQIQYNSNNNYFTNQSHLGSSHNNNTNNNNSSNSSYQIQTQFNPNISYNSTKYSNSFSGDLSNNNSKNLNISQSNLNTNSSSPHMLNSNPIYSSNSNTNNRSQLVAPTPPLQQPSQHLLNTSQSPNQRTSISVSSTPTPAPTTTPTPTPSTPSNNNIYSSYTSNNSQSSMIHTTPPNTTQQQTSIPSSTSRSDTSKTLASKTNLYSIDSIKNGNMYNPSFNYSSSYNHNQTNTKNNFNFEANYQHSNSAAVAAAAAVTMFQNHNNSSYSFPNPSSNTFPSLPQRPDYGPIGFSNNSSSNLMHNNQHYDSLASNNHSSYLSNSAASNLNHQFLMNGNQTMPHLNHTNSSSSRFNPNLSADNSNKTNKMQKSNEPAVQPAAAATKKTSSKSKKTSKQQPSVTMPITTSITPPSNGPILTPITPSTTPTPTSSASHLTNTIDNSSNYNGYHSNGNTTNNASSNSKYHESMLNWYDFTSSVTKNTEAAAIASLSNFFHKQQVENVSSYNKMMSNNSNDYSMPYNSSNIHNSAINWNNGAVQSNLTNSRGSQNQNINSLAPSQLDPSRQFPNNNTHQSISHQNHYNSQSIHLAQNTNPLASSSLSNFFASTKPPLKTAVSQEDLISNSNNQSRAYQQSQVSSLSLNTAANQPNVGYNKPAANSLPRSASSTANSTGLTPSDNYQRNALNLSSSNTLDCSLGNSLLRNNLSGSTYQPPNYVTNQTLSSQSQSSSMLNNPNSFANTYQTQFNNNHSSSINSSNNHLLNNSLQNNNIHHHQAIAHHLNPTPAAAAAAAAAVAAAAAFPHHPRQAAAMSSIFAATTNVPQFNRWN